MFEPQYWASGSVGSESSPLLANQWALDVTNMSKDYKKGFFSSEAVSALRPFSIQVPNSTILCMLGHNGGV
jgi:ABC-type glutathione transport system ATPase component